MLNGNVCVPGSLKPRREWNSIAARTIITIITHGSVQEKGTLGYSELLYSITLCTVVVELDLERVMTRNSRSWWCLAVGSSVC